MKENKSENGRINFELLESYSPKDFILIKEPPKYPMTLPQEKFLFLNINARQTRVYKGAGGFVRGRRLKRDALKVKLISTALAAVNQHSDISILYKEIEKREEAGSRALARTGTRTRVGEGFSGFPTALKYAVIFLAVAVFFFTGVLVNRLYFNHYDEGIEVAKKTVNTVAEISADFGGETMLSSAVIISESGGRTYLLTNCHAVSGAVEIKVKLYGSNEQFVLATLEKEERDTDLALISIARTGLKKAVFSSDSAEYGQTVYAVGNALGGGIAITKGIVSQPRVNIAGKLPADPNQFFKNNLAIKFDAAINHGNSGGGLFNKRGELIGVVFGFLSSNPKPEIGTEGETLEELEIVYTHAEGVQGVAYAVPVSLINNFLNS